MNYNPYNRIKVIDTTYETTPTYKLFNSVREIKDSPLYKVYIDLRILTGEAPHHAYAVIADSTEDAVNKVYEKSLLNLSNERIRSVQLLTTEQRKKYIEVEREEEDYYNRQLEKEHQRAEEAYRDWHGYSE